jgi:hypothetical protein
MRALPTLLLCLALTACGTMRSTAPEAYVVFFAGTGTSITADGAAIIKSAAADANAHKDKMVEVAGPATKIAPGYNPGEAEPRIAAVERALVGAGVDEKRLVRASLTTGKIKVDATGAQRVEIRLVEKPAS